MNMTSANKTRRSFFGMILAVITAAPAIIFAAAKAAKPAVVAAAKVAKPAKAVAATAPKAFMKDGLYHVPMPAHLMKTLVRVRPGDKNWIG